MLIFIKKNYHITNFNNLEESTRKPKVILSFDDGYKDFIDYAVPILKKHNIIVNQNIIPYCVKKNKPPLNVLTQDFIGQSPISLLKDFYLPGFQFSTNEIENREKFGIKVSLHIKNRPMKDQFKLNKILINQFLKFDNFKSTQMMNINDIKSLIDEHEIGAHSYFHSTMKYETDSRFEKDLKLCNYFFNKNFKFKPYVYAFPNGSFRDSQLYFGLKSSFNYFLLVGNDYNRNISMNDNKFFYRFTIDAKSLSEGLFKVIGGAKF